MCSQRPFKAIDVFLVANNVVEKKQRPDIPEDCSELLAKVMERGWAHEPHERPTMEDLRQQISSVERRSAAEEEVEKQRGFM